MEKPVPPKRGDWVLFRGEQYKVTRIFKLSVHLEGARQDVRVRCLRPVEQGGLAEATVLRQMS